jgi:hypothetical protein
MRDEGAHDHRRQQGLHVPAQSRVAHELFQLRSAMEQTRGDENM